jgi:hypothetical protein
MKVTTKQGEQKIICCNFTTSALTAQECLPSAESRISRIDNNREEKSLITIGLGV